VAYIDDSDHLRPFNIITFLPFALSNSIQAASVRLLLWNQGTCDTYRPGKLTSLQVGWQIGNGLRVRERIIWAHTSKNQRGVATTQLNSQSCTRHCTETSAPEARAMLSESERDRIFKEFQETKARMLAQNASPDELTAHPATLAMLQCNAASD
jgi:hypothetical protein